MLMPLETVTMGMFVLSLLSLIPMLSLATSTGHDWFVINLKVESNH